MVNGKHGLRIWIVNDRVERDIPAQGLLVVAVDPADPTKCVKNEYKHCGYTCAKNTTRQIEHLQECSKYLAAPEVIAAIVGTSPNSCLLFYMVVESEVSSPVGYPYGLPRDHLV